MRWLKIFAAALLVASIDVEAGCIGPVIFGECHGEEVPWDTGPHGIDVEAKGTDRGLPPPGRAEGQIATRGNETRRRSIVGAIRWDAWHGPAGLDSGRDVLGREANERLTPGLAVERALGPKHWHYRLPFYAKVVGENKVEIRANSQEVMDQEIAYARQAGLDYWAFLMYHPKSPMTIGLDLYLSSRHKADIKFSIILHQVRESSQEVERLVGYMKDPEYVRVLNGRPLVYAYRCKMSKKFFEGLLAAVANAGLRRPYFVDLGRNSKHLTFDAVSTYEGHGGRRTWDRQKKSHKVIPSVSAGWDPRPRMENPVPWGRDQQKKSVRGGRRRSPEKAASDLAADVKSALEWNRENPDEGEANAVLIYAWNEFDEGGWICPTLSEGTIRLDAISKALASSGERPRAEGRGNRK